MISPEFMIVILNEPLVVTSANGEACILRTGGLMFQLFVSNVTGKIINRCFWHFQDMADLIKQLVTGIHDSRRYHSLYNKGIRYFALQI